MDSNARFLSGSFTRVVCYELNRMLEVLKLSEPAQSFLLVIGSVLVAALLYWPWTRRLSQREREALATLEEMAALGEVVPDTIHPVIDVDRCIGSGSCVRACPEQNVLAI